MWDKEVLLLLSGGLDSIVCAEILLEQGCEVICVGFDYGQPHKIELEYAEAYARHKGLPYSQVVLNSMSKVNDVVFGGRNAVMISTAFSIAQCKGYDAVCIGTNESDHLRFADCRPVFLKAMQEVGKAYGVELITPLRHKPKSEVVALAREYGVVLENAWTCYSPDDGKPCGKCYSCLGRANAES